MIFLSVNILDFSDALRWKSCIACLPANVASQSFACFESEGLFVLPDTCYVTCAFFSTGDIDLSKLPDISNRGSRKPLGSSLPRNGILSEPPALATKHLEKETPRNAEEVGQNPQVPPPAAVKEGQVTLVVAEDDDGKKEKVGQAQDHTFFSNLLTYAC
jgi:hypothetical protein